MEMHRRASVTPSSMDALPITVMHPRLITAHMTDTKIFNHSLEAGSGGLGICPLAQQRHRRERPLPRQRLTRQG